MKHIALFLAILMVFGMMPSVAMAADSDILVNERFDNVATNGKSENVQHSGDKNARVVQTDINNKAFMMSGGLSNSIVTEFANTKNSTVFSFKIKTSGVKSKFSFSFSDASRSFTPITVDGKGNLTTHDGKHIGGIPNGVYTSIQIGYNAKTKKYFVIQDGKLKVASWKSGSSVGIPVKFSISSSYGSGDENGAIYVDDIQIYNSDSVRDDLPKVAMNKEILEYVPAVPSEAGSEIIVAKDFEDSSTGGLTVTAKDNVIDIQEEKGGNHYLVVEKETSSDAYFQVSDLTAFGKYIVVETDIKCITTGAMVRLFGMRDEENSTFSYVATLATNGNITLPDGTIATKVGNNWINIAMVCDFERMCFDFYLNRELLVKNSPMSNPSFGTLASSRTYFEASNKGVVAFDNIFMYEGKELKDIQIKKNEDSNGFDIADTILPAKNKSENKLSGLYAMHLYSDSFYQKDKKITLPYELYLSEDVAMMPVTVLSDYMGITANLDGSNLAVDGKSFALKNVPETKGDIQYIAIEEAMTAIGKKYYEFEDGLIIIADNELEYKDDVNLISDLNNFMFFDRKTAKELKEIFDKSGNAPVHPRILANADTFARLRREIKTNDYISKWNKTVMAEADKYLNAPVHEYIIPDGLRLLDTSREVLDYMMALGYAYQITGNKKYAQRVWKELEAVGNFPDWNPKHFLDIGEMTTAFAVGYDWCYDEFTPEQRKFIEEKIINYGLLEGKKFYEGSVTGTDFVKSQYNWNVVCNGGLSVGAMAIADKYPDVAFYTIECALRSLEKLVPSFAPDGGWGEGPGYWGYTMRYFIYFMDSLQNTFNTNFGIPEYKGISNTDQFVSVLHGNTTSNGYHDTWGSLAIEVYCFWVGKYFNKPDTTGLRLYVMADYNIAGTVKDLLWYDSSVTNTNILPPLDGFTRGTETASMRSSWTDREGMFVSYHGGNTKEGHYHIDHGSFVLDMSGIRWAIDIGPENYTSGGYFGTNRYTFYRVRAEGHNTYVINPSNDGGQDMDAFCPIIKTASNEGSAYQILDMSSAYKSSVNSALRGYMLSNGRRTFTVQDEISLKEESEIYWFMHTMANIDIIDENTAILTQDGVKMQFKIITNGTDAELSVMDARPLETSPNPETQSKNSGIRKIALKVKGSGDLNITARLTPLSENGADKELAVTKIADWVCDDSKMVDIPEAKMMYIDGVAVKEFSPKRSGYSTSLAYDYKSIPVPTLEAPGYVVEAIPTDTPDKDYQFKVYSADNPGNYRIYNLGYTVLKKLNDLFGCARYTPSKIYASAVPEEENNPMCTVDEDYVTRWAASGSQWIEQDLGSVKPVDAIAVAFSNGHKRIYKFTVQVSEDGVNYTTVYDGASAGLSEDMELFKFNSTVNARYIRYCGEGNSSNKYNTLLEYAVLRNK